MASSFEYDLNTLYNFVVRDGNGVKGMADLGLDKVPELFIHPHHERIDKLKARNNSYDQPPIDLSMLDGPWRSQVVELITEAAEKIGFFQVVNHGVPIELLESVKSAAHEFFEQSPEKKVVYRKGVSPTPFVNYGTSFVPGLENTLEWRDNLRMVYMSDAHALKFWPNKCREVALEYLKASISMVRRIIQVLMEKVGVTLDESIINDFIDIQMIQMNFYPICPNPDLTVGVGRHSDMSMLMVLLQDGIGSLYMKTEEYITNVEKEGEWMEIPPMPGALIINVGDALEVLSNGKYKSAEHRVHTTSGQSRVSIPVLTYPRLDMKIRPLPEGFESYGQAGCSSSRVTVKGLPE